MYVLYGKYVFQRVQQRKGLPALASELRSGGWSTVIDRMSDPWSPTPAVQAYQGCRSAGKHLQYCTYLRLPRLGLLKAEHQDQRPSLPTCSRCFLQPLPRLGPHSWNFKNILLTFHGTDPPPKPRGS
jgi:hypothetical protein